MILPRPEPDIKTSQNERLERRYHATFVLTLNNGKIPDHFGDFTIRKKEIKLFFFITQIFQYVTRLACMMQ
jgi:hypothetical protein